MNDIDESIRRAANQQTQSLLEAAWAVRDAAEIRRKKIRQAFELLAQKLCAQNLDRQHINLAEIGDQELFDFIVADAKTRLDEGLWYKRQYDEKVDVIGTATRDLQEQLAAAKQVQVELQARLDQTKRQLADAEIAHRGCASENATLRADIKVLERAAADRTVKAALDVQPVGTGPASVSPTSDEIAAIPTDWLEKWQQSSTYTVDAAFLNLVGNSYECRRQSLVELFVQERGRESVSGADNRVLARLIEAGVLLSVPVDRQRGNAPHLLRLSVKGIALYRLVFEKDPIDIYDRYLSKHKSTEQTLLALQACDVLTTAGCEIDRLPAPKVLDNQRIFDPDLKAWRGSETWYIEIETEAYKNPAQRKSKWVNTAEATRGYIYVITGDEPTAARIRSEALDIRYGFPVSIGVVSLKSLSTAVELNQPLFGELRVVS